MHEQAENQRRKNKLYFNQQNMLKLHQVSQMKISERKLEDWFKQSLVTFICAKFVVDIKPLGSFYEAKQF